MKLTIEERARRLSVDLDRFVDEMRDARPVATPASLAVILNCETTKRVLAGWSGQEMLRSMAAVEAARLQAKKARKR